MASELEWLVRLGLSPREAIQSATQVGAAALGLAGELGTVEIGKRADLVLVDEDPLVDVGALRGVSWVMKDGLEVPRSPEWDRRAISPLGVRS